MKVDMFRKSSSTCLFILHYWRHETGFFKLSILLLISLGSTYEHFYNGQWNINKHHMYIWYFAWLLWKNK